MNNDVMKNRHWWCGNHICVAEKTLRFERVAGDVDGNW